MRTSRLVIAIILGLVGLVWVGQGMGLIGGGAMSGNGVWAVVGIVLLVAAAVVVIFERRRTA